jgi:hypothetical protein
MAGVIHGDDAALYHPVDDFRSYVLYVLLARQPAQLAAHQGLDVVAVLLEQLL